MNDPDCAHDAPRYGTRCTACGHRRPHRGRTPIPTRYQPWRIPAELAGRAMARHIGRRLA